MGINAYLNRITYKWSLSWWLSPLAVQYYCAACGAISGIMFILAFIIAGFIPPIKPSWEAERVADYYKDHTTRIRAGAAILMISGGFYLPFSTVISNQMRRIPRLPYFVHQMQIMAAAGGVWTFILPGVVLAITSYRVDRPVELTQLMNDFFWIVALMPWPTFLVQNFSFVYAIIVDDRDKPLWPKELIVVNIIIPLLFTFATGMHTEFDGVFAWDGIITFYIVGFTFVVQLIVDAVYTALACKREEEEKALSLDEGSQHKEVGANAV